MTDLQEGSRYSLSENKNNKSVIFVKLTDSAIQSIERFFNLKDGSSSKPTIEFQDNGGIISLPQNGRSYNYGFTLSDIEGGGARTFQCLEHANDNSLKSLGFMHMKMQIHATEDSYEKTKCKMAAADQEQKNLCTKEVRQATQRKRFVGNKVSVKRPALVSVPEKSPCVLKPDSVNSKSKDISPGSLIKQPIRQRIIQILAAKSYKKAEIILRLKREGVSDKDKDQINDILCQVGKLKGNIFSLENHMWNEVKEDWEFSSEEELQLIKKKKQQFLKTNVNGVANHSKPSVKQDLLSSLLVKKTYVNGQGYLASNGNLQASKTLSTIAGNISSLQSSFVKQGHKNEGKNEKLSNIFRNITTLQAYQTESNGEINSKLPTSSYNSLESSFIPEEHRNGHINGESNVMCMEVDTNGNDAGVQDRVSNGTCSNAVSINKQTEKKTRMRRNVGVPVSVNFLENMKLFKEKFLKDVPPPAPPPSSSNKKITINGNINNSSNTLPCSNLKSAPIASPEPIIDIAEIMSKYPKVESQEQASQYVKEYNDHYDEYLKMHSVVKETSDKFSALFDQLDASIDGSPQNKKIKLEIVKEYDIALKNSYRDSRRKYEFLKAKLMHLKKLVMEYNENL